MKKCESTDIYLYIYIDLLIYSFSKKKKKKNILYGYRRINKYKSSKMTSLKIINQSYLLTFQDWYVFGPVRVHPRLWSERV